MRTSQRLHPKSASVVLTAVGALQAGAAMAAVAALVVAGTDRGVVMATVEAAMAMVEVVTAMVDLEVAMAMAEVVMAPVEAVAVREVEERRGRRTSSRCHSRRSEPPRHPSPDQRR
jgi:proteasome assembly chaperone (PAC2) family protein